MPRVVVLPPFLGAGRCRETAVTCMYSQIDVVVPEVLNPLRLVADQRPASPCSDDSAPAAVTPRPDCALLPFGDHLPPTNMQASGTRE